jgi:hypothetical protein
MLSWTGEMGQGAQQHFATGPDAQLGLSAGHVALFLAEMWPKEAKGGALYGSKKRHLQSCVMWFGIGLRELTKTVYLVNYSLI